MYYKPLNQRKNNECATLDGNFFQGSPVGLLCSPQIENPSSKAVGRYVDIMLDKWFSRIFGAKKNKQLLLEILRELLPERQIVDLEYNRKQVRKGNVFEDCHDAVFDVECIDKYGVRFVVEMQRTTQKHFHERLLFYASLLIQEQVIARNKKNGKLNHDLHFDYPPAYIISFLNYSFHPRENEVVYRYDITERRLGELMTDRINFIILEMTNYKRGDEEPHDDDSFAEKLSWTFTHMSSLTERPASLMGKVFEKIFEVCEVSSLEPDAKQQYEQDMTTQWDIDDQITTAYLDGRDKGREEGREEGRKEAATRIAIKMLSLDMNAEDIAQATGLSVNEVDTLMETTVR